MRLLNMGAFFSLIVFFASGAFSAEKVPPTLGPKITLLPGQEVTYAWADGREAKLMISSSIILMVPAPFQITENLCNPINAGMKCTYEVGIKLQQLSVVWTHHPDTTKIGKIVKRSDDEVPTTPPSPPTELKSSIFWLSTSRAVAQKATSDLPKDRIRCDDFTWIPGNLGKSPPATAYMNRWESELMQTNAETDVNENRAFGGYMGLTLTKDSPDSLELTSAKAVTSSSPFSLPPITDASSITFTEAHNSGTPRMCQITVQTDFQKVVQRIRAVEDKFTGNSPYIMGSDETLDVDMNRFGRKNYQLLERFTYKKYTGTQSVEVEKVLE